MDPTTSNSRAFSSTRRARSRSSSSLTEIAAAGAWSSVGEGNSVGLKASVLDLDFDALAEDPRVLQPATTGATGGDSSRNRTTGFSIALSIGSGSTRFDLSVTISCFFSVFSFLASRCSAARARTAFHSAQRWEIVEMELKRLFKKPAAHANENVVARINDTNRLVTRTTAVPGPFSVASSFSDRIVPTRPPGGMCPRICGNAGRRAKAAENVRTINAIPMARTMSLRTGQEASQQKP